MMAKRRRALAGKFGLEQVVSAAGVAERRDALGQVVAVHARNLESALRIRNFQSRDK
jgi:hypothetical protein